VRFNGMSSKSDVLALVFGALLILLTFGDSHLTLNIGNLDSVFGRAVWPLLDVACPLASIAVFLRYGRVKGGLRINVLTIAVFLSYLVAIALISLDDIAAVLHLLIMPPKAYWAAVEWFYPIYSSLAFFVFGKANQVKKITDRRVL
jgi:hypothetical protein